MRRIAFACVVAALAFPASALATGARGVVLSVDSRHHTIQVVDAKHLVHAYRFHGRLPALHLGSRIHYQRSRTSISHVQASSHNSHRVAFLGRVLHSSSKGLALRLADGKVVKFTSKQLRRHRTRKVHGHARRHAAGDPQGAGNITISIQGLQPGVTVLVTETIGSDGSITITITLPPASVLGNEQTASGVVVQVDTNTFLLQTGDGSDLNLHVTQNVLANLSACDLVSVTYHQDAGMLIADTVQKTGSSTASWCSGDGSDQDVIGTITQVSPSGLTVTTDRGPMSFTVDDPSITDGFVVGDQVDVTYADNGDGTFTADDVEYVQQDATGTVTAVSAGSLTITDDATGQPVTFSSDPSNGMFDGIGVGDQVDVTYHQSGSLQVVDAVDDSGSGGGD